MMLTFISQQFDASSGDTPTIPGFEKYPTLDKRIQCCIIFLDASTFEAMSPEVTQNIKDNQIVMNSLGTNLSVFMCVEFWQEEAKCDVLSATSYM